MKKVSLITAGLLALGLISTASAQTTTSVYITGSSAFRGNVNAALTDATGSGIFDAGGPSSIELTSGAYGGTLAAFPSTTSEATFTGTIGGAGNTYEIFTHFTGSEAGIASLLGVTIVNNGNPGHSANLAGTPAPSFVDPSDTTTFTHAPDIAMADTSQTVSLTTSPTLTEAGSTGLPVGIVQFIWAKGENNGQTGWSDLSNISVPQAHVLIGAGKVPLSFLTGNSLDFNTSVRLVGRNKGSGTRVNCMLDNLHATTDTVKQYAPTPVYTGNVLQVPGYVNTLADANFTFISADGYDSGGGVAVTLEDTGSGMTLLPVGYIGLVDASTAQSTAPSAVITLSGSALSFDSVTKLPVGGFSVTGNALTLDGVAYSDAAIVLGAYDYYGHENMYVSPTIGTPQNNVASSLYTYLQGTLTGGLNGIPAPALLATRPGDVGYVAPN